MCFQRIPLSCKLYPRFLNMNVLYIIGNGFDLAHDLKTSYNYFAKFIKWTNSELFDQLMSNCELEDRVDLLWSNFEKEIGEIDLDSFLDINEPIPMEDSSFDRGSRRLEYCSVDETRESVVRLSKQIIDGFESWVEKVNIQGTSEKFSLLKNAKYLSFNYTNTLEEVYGIENVCHIHGAVGKHERLIFGHRLIYEHKGCVFEDNNQAVTGFHQIFYKESEEICKAHADFFSTLKDINTIVVLGHSLSNVDQYYYEHLRNFIDFSGCKFCVSYRHRDEIERMKLFLFELGIEETQIVFSSIEAITEELALLR